VSTAEGVIQRASHKSKHERINDVLARWHKEASGAVTKFPAGFARMDSMLNGGFSPAGLSFVGGYAGEGKSDFALSVAIHLARAGVNVSFLEGEMPEDELHDRAARMTSGPGSKARLDWLAEYESLPLDFLLLSDRTPSRLLGAAERAVLDGARFVVVDYLQTFSQIERDADKHYLAIKNLSAQLRALLLRQAEKGVMLHIMALSNLNRSEAGSGRPGLSSLYGSSGLAHDCTEAIMVYSENSESARFQELQTGERSVTVEVVKARNGRRGPLPFVFTGGHHRFREQELTEVRRAS
jgi:replicative DNA helicase